MEGTALEQLEKDRSRRIRRFMFFKWIIISILLAMIAAIVIAIVKEMPNLVFVTIVIIPLSICSFCYFFRYSDYKDEFNDELLRTFVGEKYPDFKILEYGVSSANTTKAGLFERKRDMVRSNDIIMGCCKGINFITADIVYNDIGTSAEGRNVILSTDEVGRWYQYTLNSNIGQTIRVFETSTRRDVNIIGLTKCVSENSLFNEKFTIYASDTEKVFDILKPETIEFIVEIEKKIRGELIFSFVDNCLYICVKDKKDHFRFNPKKRINNENLGSYYFDINLIGEFIVGFGLDEIKADESQDDISSGILVNEDGEPNIEAINELLAKFGIAPTDNIEIKTSKTVKVKRK